MSHLDGRIVLHDHVVSGRVSFDSHIRDITPCPRRQNATSCPVSLMVMSMVVVALTRWMA